MVFYLLFVLGGLELAVPVVAERKGETSWHRHHIIERYGLLDIIVLGESLLAATLALRAAMGDHFDMALLHVAISALVIVFMLWWLYFAEDDPLETQDLHRSLIWGYDHVVIFGSGAALGAGFAVLVDIVTHHAEVGLIVGDIAVAVTLALYLGALWIVRDRYCLTGPDRMTLPVFAVLILLSPLTPFALEAMALSTVLCVVARSYAVRAGATPA